MGISVLIICKFSNKWTCTRKKEVEGLSCGFEGLIVVFERAPHAGLSTLISANEPLMPVNAACLKHARGNGR